MRCNHNQVDLMIDNWDICLTQAKVLKRWPTVGDFKEISYDRAYWAAEDLCDLHSRSGGVSATLYNTEESLFGASFRTVLWADSRSLNRLVIENGDSPSSERQFEDYMISQLRLDGDSCDCPLVYVGGAFRFPRIRKELLYQAGRRNVTIMAFWDLNHFSTEDLKRFEYIYEFVEITPEYMRRYMNLIESRSRERETDKESVIALAATVNVDEQREQREQREASRRRPRGTRIGTSDLSVGGPQSQRQLTSGKARSDLFDPSLPLIVVIDSENIDGHLFKMHNPNGTEGVELDRNNRMDWMKLRDWIRSTSGTQSTLIAPFFSYFESDEVKRNKVMAFADFLRRNGFDPREIKREGDRQVVDEAIIKMLSSLTRRPANVLLVSHDGGYLPSLNRLHESHSRDGKGRIVLAGFPEQMNVSYQGLGWLKLLDLEHDMKVFNYQLPSRNDRNLRATNSIDDFDAEDFLARSSLFPQLKERGSGA